MTMHIARKVVQSFQQTAATAKSTENLSPREQEVLDHLSRGFLYKEIAEKMGVSYETVHTYIRRIYEKLQVRTGPKPWPNSFGSNCQPRMKHR